MKVTHEVITPERAAKLLEANTRNFRNVNWDHVKALGVSMTRGEWADNGTPIRMRKDGTLADGQHRLHACITSGVPFACIVITELEDDRFIDSGGQPRTTAQELAHRGYKNASLLAAVAKLAMRHDKRKWNATSDSRANATNPEVIEFVKNNHDALQDSLFFHRLKFLAPATPSAILFLGTRKLGVSASKLARWFKDSLATGLDLKEYHGHYHVRRRLENSSSSSRPSDFIVRMMLTKAWNCAVMDEPATAAKIRVTLGGDNPPPLPNEVFVARDIAQAQSATLFAG